MLKVYQTTYKFYYDGELEYRTTTTQLSDHPYEEEFSGTDFDSLWNLYQKYPMMFPFNAYEWKRGRYLEFYDSIFRGIREWKNNCKPWRLVATSREITITMNELERFDADDVIQYLKERGITTCPMNF